MHRRSWNERCGGASTSFNATSDTGARRSNKTTWNRTDTRHHDARAESICASGNTANKSDDTAGKYGHSASYAFANATGRYRAWWLHYAVVRAAAGTSY